MEATIRPFGRVGIRRMNIKAPLSWRLRNSLRWGYIWGLLTTWAAHLFTKITGVPTLLGELRLVLFHGGQRIDHGVVSRRLVTDTGVAYIVDAFQTTTSVELENMKYHGVGTGGTAEAADQTSLITECTTATNPDSTRATGTTIEGATANIYKTVATVAFDDTAAITEHMIASAATSTHVMIDRSLFAAVNVVSGDSIEFTYQLTLTSGG